MIPAARSRGKRDRPPQLNVMTVRDGMVVHSREYSDPIAVSQVLGFLPQLAEQLSSDAGT